MKNNNKKLSIIIPCYNEEKTIIKLLKMVNNVKLNNISKEIIVVDDSSTDSSLDLLKSNKSLYTILKTHKENLGKGAAVKTGIKVSKGDYIIIQDADLEYNPKDYNKLIEAIQNNECDAVYGSRFKNKKYNKGHLFNRAANSFFNYLFKKLYKYELTDVLSCYKIFKSETLKKIELLDNRFGFDVEVTLKIVKENKKIIEVPISYNPRSKKEGKKIGLKDGINITKILINNRNK